MDAKVEAIANEAQSVKQSLPLPLPETEVQTTQSTFVEQWIPTRAEMEAFLDTELGKGALIFVTLATLTLLGLRIFGGKNPSSDIPQQMTSSRMPEATTPVEQKSQLNSQPAHTDDNSGALESAIERLKSKIEDPEKLKEAEELYSVGDDALIDVFSADALNQNPEWGEDPDDEADVASHQLELAQNYLDMGMTQTAIELLERVSVSPDQASANKARALLDVHRS